jgi:hypothetical protein
VVALLTSITYITFITFITAPSIHESPPSLSCLAFQRLNCSNLRLSRSDGFSAREMDAEHRRGE